MVDGHTIDLGELWEGWRGQWVKVRPRLSYARQQAMESVLIDDVADDDPVANVPRMVRFNCEVTDQAVIEWHLLGHDGEPLPQGVEGIMHEEAPPDLLAKMFREIANFYGEQRPAPFQSERAREATGASGESSDAPDSGTSSPPNRATRRRAARSRGRSSPKTSTS